MSGWAASGQEAMNEAVSLLSRAINLDADHAMAYTMLGVCLLSVRRHDEAGPQVIEGLNWLPVRTMLPSVGHSARVLRCTSGIAAIRCDSPTSKPSRPAHLRNLSGAVCSPVRARSV